MLRLTTVPAGLYLTAFSSRLNSAREQAGVGPDHRFLLVVPVAPQVDVFLLREGPELVGGVHRQHGEHARFEAVGVGFGLGQLHEGVGQAQGATDLLLYLSVDLLAGFVLGGADVEQGEDRRVRRAQVMGEEAQEGGALALGIAFGAQVDQAHQPADGGFAFDRQQARQVEAQVAFPVVAELDGFQGFQRWAGATGEARMAEFGQALAQFGAAQLAAEQVACLAVGQQDLPLRVADQGRHRQAFQAVGHEPPAVAGAADRLLQGGDAVLQWIVAGARGLARSGSTLGSRSRRASSQPK